MAYIGKRPQDTFPAGNAITATSIAANAVNSSEIATSAVTTLQIAADAVTLAKMAGLTRGNVIIGDASGNPTALALGTSGYVLKSDGTDIAWAVDAGLSTEEVQDIAGAMFTGNTETDITATYQDADGTIDLVVGTLNQSTTGSAATLTTARTIGGVSFDGSANIDLAGVNTTGNQNTSGTSSTVTGAAQTAITSVGTLTALQVDNLNINGNTLSSTAGLDLNITPLAGQQLVLDGTIVVDAGVVTGATSVTSTSLVGALTGNADTATTAAALTTARTIGGTSFDGSANIAVALAGTATTLATARTIGGISFDGSANIDLAGVNTAGNQNTSGTAATVTGAAQTAITSVGTLTALQVDNLNVNGNTISSTAGLDLNITPLAGQQLVLDGTIIVDAGVVTGATSITSTALVGALTGNADTATTAAALTTTRAIAVAGDVTGTANFDGSAAISITTALATDAIVTANITNANVTTAKIADNAITAAKIPDGSIGALQLTATAVTAGSYGSATAIPTLTVDADGRLTAASTAAISSALTVAADSGVADTVTIGTDTLTFEGTANEIETTVSNNKINIGLPTNVTIAGNLTVAGTQTTVSSTTITVADPLVALASGNNAADAVDIGLYGLYDTSGTLDLYSGLFRDASDSGKWKLFKDTQAAPTTTVNTAGTGYAVGTLVANIEGAVTGDVTGNVTGNTSGTSGSTTGNAATATVLATARTLGGVSFNGSANIDLPGVNAAGNQNTSGSAATLTTTRAIGGVNFDGSAAITLPGVNAAGNQNTSGSAATLTTPRAIGGVNFDGSAAITLPGVNSAGNQNTSGTSATVTGAAQTAITSVGTLTALQVDNLNINGNTLSSTAGLDLNITPLTGQQLVLDGTIIVDAGVVTGATSITSTALVGALTGNSDTATALATARTIGGTSFDGSANIAVALASTATTLATARTIGGVSFDGSAAINLPGVNSAGNQNTSGSAATVTGAAQTAITSVGTLTALQIDNLNINGNTISSTAGVDLNITPLAGQQLVLDGTIVVDAGVVTGATSITSTSLVGALTGNSDTATALATTRAIAVAGDVTGTANFDGSAAISITTTLATDAIVTANITDANVTTAKIANNAVTGDKIADDIVLSGTGSIRMPDGTTAQRPGTPAAGMFRYNTTLSKFEGYTDAWGEIGGAGASTFTRKEFTGDGTTTAFTLDTTPSDENDLMVFIEGVYQNQDAFSVSGAVLTFVDAPVLSRGVVVYHVSAAVAGAGMAVNTMTGDNSTTTLTLAVAAGHVNNVQVFFDGVYQKADTYTISGTTLTFGVAPPTSVLVEARTHAQTEINTFPATGISGLTEVTAAGADHFMIYDATDSSLKKALVSDVLDNVVLTNEQAQDIVGAMFTSTNTESGITVTYQDATGDIDLTVGTLNQNTTGSAATLTTPRAIAVAGDVTGTANFDGSAAISITTTLATDAIVTANITDDQVTGAKIENAVTIATSATSPLLVATTSARVTQVAITSTSAAVAWDSTAAANAYHVTTENTTFSAPSNAVEGAIIQVELAQGGTARTIAWNTVFEFAASTAPTVTATASKTDIFTFRYNGSVWQEIGRVQNLAQT